MERREDNILSFLGYVRLPMRKSAKSDMGLLLCAAFRHKYNLPFLTRVVMAELMQCSRERVRQIEARALRKIRRQLTTEDWEQLNEILQMHRTRGIPAYIPK
jgi:hypothetical protein